MPKAGTEARRTGATRRLKGRARYLCAAMLALVAALGVTATADAAQWTPAGSFGSLRGPVGIDVAHDGNLWVVENNVNEVGKYTPDGTRLLSIGGFGTAPGQFNGASALAVAPNGDIYVTDVGGNRVQHFTDDGTLVGTFGSGGAGPGQFEAPYGIAVDAAGNVYVADTFNGRLQKFSATGDYIETIGAPFQFGAPYGVEVDPDGNVWVTDHDSGTVRKVAPDGTVLQALTGFGQPTNVVVDGTGQVHVVNWNTQRIETYSPSGTLVDQLQFDAYVHSIALGSDGRLFATLPHIGEIRTFTPPAPADTDGDGIPDAIDVDPGVPSTAFRDAAGHNGRIVTNPGLSVSFVDLPDPDGVKIVVDGPATSRVTLELCVSPGGGPGFTTRVNGGSQVEAFCGSVKLHVLAGEADVVLGTTTVQITEGVTGKVRDNGDGTFAVDHIAGGPVTIASPAGTTSLAEGQLPTLDVTPPQLTVPASTVNLKPTGAGGITYGTAAGYPGVSASDDRTAAPTVACTPAAPHTFALGSDTTVSCTATDEAGLSTTKLFTVHVGVTAGTLCAYTVDTVLGSARAKALSAAKRTALQKQVTTGACATLDGLTAGLTSAKKAAIVALYGRAVDRLAVDGWLTAAQAARLKSLAGQL